MIELTPAKTLVVLLCALCVGGCGGKASFLTISLASSEVSGDGKSSTIVTLTAIFLDAPASDGTRINVSATGGSFEPDSEITSITPTTVGGEAQISWYAPAYDPDGVSEFRISGSFEDDYSQTRQATANVLVVPPPPIQGSSFSFSCTATNVGAPLSGESKLRLPCNVSATDDAGNTVQVDNARFGFLTEAGEMKIGDPDFCNGDLCWVLAPGEQLALADVTPGGSPDTGEPRWVDPVGTRTRNPRDGIAALVVHTVGLPTGASDVTQGEPFVDSNDNGAYDVGERWFDDDGNGSYTPAVGVEARRIWRWYKIMITGAVSVDAPRNAGPTINLFGPGNSLVVDIPWDETRRVSVLLLDANLNPLASHPSGGGDTVQLTTDNSRAAVTPQSLPLIRDDPANPVIAFDPITGAIPGFDTRLAYNGIFGAAEYEFEIKNTLSDTAATESWAIDDVLVRRTPSPGGRTTTTNLPATGFFPGGELSAL